VIYFSRADENYGVGHPERQIQHIDWEAKE
jgi:hypothetical protein